MSDELPFFKRIGIFGVGLLGGSLGLALKERDSAVRIVGIGRSEQRLGAALDMGAIDEICTDPAALRDPLDCLVLCTPVRMIPGHFERALPALRDGAVITDVGSTKKALVESCEAVAGRRVRFVGSHPMAGSHESGVEAAKADLFDNRMCVMTPTAATDPEALRLTIDLWKLLGMRIVEMSPADHDRFTALSSHLPHLTASALCHAVQTGGDGVKPVIGSGFIDSTRLAEGNPELWLDICLDNREAISAAIDALRESLDALQRRMNAGDEEAVSEFLTSAQSWKLDLLASRQSSSEGE